MIKIGDWVENERHGIGVVIDIREKLLVCVYYPHINELHNAEYNKLPFRCSGGHCWNERPYSVMGVG